MTETKFLVGSKYRREINPVLVAFNHKQNGNLCIQRFTTTEELPNSHTVQWQTVETAQQKIEGFRLSDWVANVTEIPEANSHAAALFLAREKYGMKMLRIEKKGRKKRDEEGID